MSLDFLEFEIKEKSKGNFVLVPNFITYSETGSPIKDLMVRGGDFYAIWDEEHNAWSTNEGRAFFLIDKEIRAKAKESDVNSFSLCKNASSGAADMFHKYCQKQLRDNFHPLDEKIIFANHEIVREDYASKKLPYSLEEGTTDAWDELMSVLYSPEELRKLEWSVGAIVTGASKYIQKFVVLYGSAGTGKSTFLNIVQMLFDGYYAPFDSEALGNRNAAFALESFKSNPLVAIQHDGDLSKIDTNTRLNSIVSHEEMQVNTKYAKMYSQKFHSFLYLGTNKPVKITDSKSGLLRRLIDVTPTGNTMPYKTYKKLMKNVEYELGAIAYKCKELYLSDPEYYDGYRPLSMMGATNDFYNYILDYCDTFEQQDFTTLKQAWSMYKEYVADAAIPYPYTKLRFKEELKNYFMDFKEEYPLNDKHTRNVYLGFRIHQKGEVIVPNEESLIFDNQESLLDEELKDCLAQYATKDETPRYPWARVTETLESINTRRLHYVKPPINHIVIDFDIPDPDTGEKSFEYNLEAASKFPPTYAELSKSGKGIHLHYWYNGDIESLETIYADHIEIKKFTGGSALRRKLTKCNNLPITTISSGLPTKGEVNMADFEGLEDEKHLINCIMKALRKEVNNLNSTKQHMWYIKQVTDEAYSSGISYDISNLRPQLYQFAISSSNNEDYCVDLYWQLHLKSVDREGRSDPEPIEIQEKEPKIIFLDIEVVPNLLLVCWKAPGPDSPVVRLFNPSPAEIEDLLSYDIVGHNVRDYDNHILYGRWQGYNNDSCYKLSKRIISGDQNAKFPSAYGLSYADTLDYPLKRQSLKAWQIELGFPHKEMDIDWDQPLPEDRWDELADYCENDVRATEAVWDATQADFRARQILAKIAGGKPNDKTNTLSEKFVFGNNRNPQSEFNYRDMGDTSQIDTEKTKSILKMFPFELAYPEYTVFDSLGRPIFPSYIFENGKSVYRGEDPKEGGYVYALPGFWALLALLDIASMHPSSYEAEELFGEFTKRLSDIKQTRIYIKHGEFDKARKMFDGILTEFLEDEQMADDLANALKRIINSVYGLTAAKFKNRFRDPRNKDNIVAKRGALFMINLKHEVQARGFKVAHIKTDSIKIPDATPEIIEFVNAYGKLYGYDFEHEATYEKMLLMDRANYIAKYTDPETCQKTYNYIPGKNAKAFKNEDDPKIWTVTGDKFAHPYILKNLFTHKEMEFSDFPETKKVTTCIYLDMNESLPDVTAEEKELSKLETKYRKGQLSDTTFEPEFRRLTKEIAKGHNYTFVGKVGSFVPVVEGNGGGILVRYNDKTGKYGAVEGTKRKSGRAFRWLETTDYIYRRDNMNNVELDLSYYEDMVVKVLEDIQKVYENQMDSGEFAYTTYDFEWLLSDVKPEFPEYTATDLVDGSPIYPTAVPFH